jgi:hypothetical protein
MAAYNKFQVFVANQNNGVHNLGADTLKVMLTNTAPVATNAVYADVSGTELANGNGYTTGGATISGVTSTQTTGTYKLVGTLASPTWTASGSMGPFRYAIFYDTTPASPLKPLIAWWDYGSSLTLSAGQTFTVSLDGTNGIFQEA